MNGAQTAQIMDNTMEDITNIWEFCPDELLICIFKFSDPEMLLNCMFVNKKWKDAAEHVAECHNAWPEILQLVNLYTTVNNKTTLPNKDLFTNSILWDKVQIAKSTHINTYQMPMIKKISIYKDQLIVCTEEEVQFYDIIRFKLNKTLPIKCLDYQENDIMVLKLITGHGENDLELCGKLLDDLGQEGALTVTCVTHYLLQHNHCYSINEYNLLWDISWTNNSWVKTFVGRYFSGEGAVTALHVYKQQMYIATKSGNIMRTDSQQLLSIQKFSLPFDNYLLGMFNKIDVIVSAAPKASSKAQVGYHRDLDQASITIKGLSCVMEHGPVVFLGTRNGMVYAYLIRKLRDLSGPERCFHVAELDSKIKDREITNIEVHEAALSHHLFISTRTQIFQILLTYPENYDYWDFASLHR